MKKLNIYKAKESEILNHKYKIAELDLADLNDEDINLITMLNNLYSSELVENSKIIAVKEKKFVVSKVDIKNLSGEVETTPYDYLKDVPFEYSKFFYTRLGNRGFKKNVVAKITRLKEDGNK